MAVFPVHSNIFKINIKGRTNFNPVDMVQIKDMESFSLSIDGNTEEWTPMDQAGWTRRAMTGKGLTISLSGKRNYGDPGNDYVAGLVLAVGSGVECEFEWVMPSGAKLTGNCVLDVKTPGGGDSTNIDGLEVDILSDGKPTFYPANNVLTFTTVDGVTAGKTRIGAITPALGAGNSYKYALNVDLPSIGSIAASGWTTLSIGTDYTAVENDVFVVVEVNASNVVQKVGWSHANVQ